jgi:hypothetical protein
MPDAAPERELLVASDHKANVIRSQQQASRARQGKRPFTAGRGGTWHS